MSESWGPIRIAVDDDFPDGLDRLSTAELQVLHSRVIMQLDDEYLVDEDPHPVTLDRHTQVARMLRDRSSNPS